MSYNYQFRIADVVIGFESEHPLSVHEELKLFDENAEAEFTYKRIMHEHLPQIPESETVRYYYDHVRNRYYAITEDHDDHMVLHLEDRNLPWGNEIWQLYTLLALPHVLLKRNKLVIHASYIYTDKGAILFTAPSGTGKSTQAELWKQFRNANIANGDRAVVGMRGTVPMAYGYPLKGSSEYCENHTQELRAIVSLKQAPKNYVKRLSGFEQIKVLINGSFLPQEYATDLTSVIDVATELCKFLPILELSCTADEDAVLALEKALDVMDKNGG